MTDKIKIILSIFFFLLAVTLPIAGVVPLLLSWLDWIEAPPVSIVVYVVILSIIFFFGGCVMLIWVRKNVWFTVLLPYIFGVLYSILPDFIPLKVDDAITLSTGAIFSFILAIRNDKSTPRWILFPLLAAGAYAFIGGFLPGPIDEILVDGLALFVSIYGMTRDSKELVEEDSLPTPNEEP